MKCHMQMAFIEFGSTGCACVCVCVNKGNNCFQDLKHEAERINNINILVCTPGRLLQHMDETISFHATNLQMLGESQEFLIDFSPLMKKI